MKVAIVGTTGSIGGRIFQHVLQRNDVESVVAVSRRPLARSTERVQNAVIPDFGDLDSVSEEAWTLIQNVDALIWAAGTYDLNEDVNFTYPLEFQRHLAMRQDCSHARDKTTTKFRFILLGGAFTETDQSRWLYFLPDQRRMKGLLQTRTLEFAESHGWAAHVVRPGGVLMGNRILANKAIEAVFGNNLAIRGDELGAFVAKLAVNGSDKNVIENFEMVENGRRLSAPGT